MRAILSLTLVVCCQLLAAQDFKSIDRLVQDAKFSEARRLANEQLALAPDEGTAAKLKAKVAETFIYEGAFSEAEKVLGGIETTEPVASAVVLTTSGLLYMNQGRNDRALEVGQQAVNKLTSADKMNTIEGAQAISNFGLVLNATGKYQQAQEQLQMAVVIREKLLPPNDPLLAASYNDLGLAFAGSDNDKALDYYDKALKIYEVAYGKNHPKMAIGLVNTAIIYRNLELYGDAVNNFEAALKIWETVHAGAHPSKAFCLSGLGDTYVKMQNLTAAQAYYEKALQMYRQSYGESHPDIAQVLNAIGNLALSAEKFDLALQHYDNAIKANSRNTASSGSDLEYYNGRVLLYSMLNKAQALEKKYFGKTLKLTDLKSALALLQQCDRLVDELRKHSSNENDKLTLGAIANEVYADGVRICHEIALNAIDRQPYVSKAFYFAEKSKSAVLLEAISDANAKSFAGIPAELLDKEHDVKSTIALTAQKLAARPDPEQEKALREALFRLNSEYTAFIKQLESDYPNYFNLKFNAAPPTLTDVQNVLTDDTALLSYFTDEKNNRLYIFVIGPGKIRMYDKAIPKDYDKFITGLRNSIYFNEINAFKKSSLALAAILIPPIQQKVKNLVILPTGRMSIIPFEALLVGKSKAENFNQLNYLVDRFAVRYEFSASLLLEKSKKSAAPARSIFLCAPVDFSTEALPDLPGTESEVREISELFARQNMGTRVVLHADASEEMIKSTTSENFGFIHFATHGIVDEKNPELSRIFLQNSSPAQDGNLYAGEIYNMNLKANLVTLSACQTGLGKLAKGEGVIGLSRALVYAGAKNIIVSFWSVADESTALLMKDFYDRLLASGKNFSESLQASKIALRKNERYASPYYWAPFILIGNN